MFSFLSVDNRQFLLGLLVVGLAASGLSAQTEPKAFYVNYAFNVPTDILTEHAEAIVHPNAQVDLASAAQAGTRVYAYISVGELGANAPHRQEALDLGLPLRGKNPIWDSDLLDLTTGEWAVFLVDNIAKLAVEKGFLGFFLDTLDSIQLETDATEREAQRAGLVALIKRLHDTYPGLHIIVNRGFNTLPHLGGIVDGLMVESVYAAYDFEENYYRPTAAAETAKLELVMQNAVALGLEVYVLDYADPADPAAGLAAAQRILDAGYHAFVSTPALTGEVLGPWHPVIPAILAQPIGLTLRPGQDLGLRVLAVGAPTPNYTWYFNDVPIANDTAQRLVIENAQLSDAGRYRVDLSNRYGAVSSTTVDVIVNEFAGRGRLTNLSTRAWAEEGGAQLIPGVVSDGNVELLARAVGPTLADFQVENTVLDPGLAVVRAEVERIANADWSDGGSATLIAVTAAEVGAFALRENSADAALILELQGAATLPVDTAGGDGGTALVELYEISGEKTTGRLTNLSIRANIRSGGDSIVMGFVLGGESASQLLVRAVGPELATFGVVGSLTNPTINLYRGGELLAKNDDWGTSSVATLSVTKGQAVGAFPLTQNSRDAAVVLTLPPGAYTAVVNGGNADTGIVLAEVYLLP